MVLEPCKEDLVPTLLFDLERHGLLYERLHARAKRDHVSWDAVVYRLLEEALVDESVPPQIREALRRGPDAPSRRMLTRRDRALELLAQAGERGITSFALRQRLGISSAAVGNLLGHLRQAQLLDGEVGPAVTEKPGRPPMYYRLRGGNEAWLQIRSLYEQRAAQVLLLLSRSGVQSSLQLEEATNWSRATVSSVTRRLLSEGSIHQVNIRRDTPGRPEVGFQLPPTPPVEPA
ncbi:MAG: hypothetical protein KKD10_07215 [Candidatus Omnitrophica bacterium]|nr:hypothetical protein [Candidatus Omnitrophota bacterium]